MARLTSRLNSSRFDMLNELSAEGFLEDGLALEDDILDFGGG
jgi:hypothetical protein